MLMRKCEDVNPTLVLQNLALKYSEINNMKIDLMQQFQLINNIVANMEYK